MAGVFVDRHDLRRLLVWANLGQALAVSLLLLAPGGTSLVLVFVVAVLQSTLAAFSQPAETRAAAGAWCPRTSWSPPTPSTP